MENICGVVEEKCFYYDDGVCKNTFCSKRVSLPDNERGRIDLANFKYMAKILYKQELILKRLDDLKVK